ncbi:hypothetical protein B9G53_10060 [Pseudanabaena sp. SR411]|uniref:HEAT repeat domain-containing protein n=1 Tax=Pseudanabaena sp. SR411 TaxID=1980935 RepID=UPI000B99A147|nr:HEAT repeat domain-containing protein [Pseudanabaena sp. SR411]OYQ64774.1 hypothetical protein B9G53_10060 [Pseudanabaena sp. SR411]
MANSHNLDNWSIVYTAFASDWELGTNLVASFPIEQQQQAIDRLIKADISDLYRTYLLCKLKTPAVLPYLLSALPRYPQIVTQGMRLQSPSAVIPHLIHAIGVETIALLGELGVVAAIEPIATHIRLGGSGSKDVSLDALIAIGRQALQRHRQRQPYPRDRHKVESEILVRRYQECDDVDTLIILASALYDIDRKQAIACLKQTDRSRDGYGSTQLQILLFQAGSYSQRFSLKLRIQSYLYWLFNKIKYLWQKPRFQPILIGITTAVLKVLWDSLYYVSETEQRRKVALAFKEIGGEKFCQHLRDTVHSEDPDVVQGALEMLGAMGDIQSIPICKLKLGSDDSDTRMAAILALVQIGTVEAFNSAIMAITKQSDSDLALAEIEQVSQTIITNPEAIPVLIHILLTGDADEYMIVDKLFPDIQRLQAKYAPVSQNMPDDHPVGTVFGSIHPLVWLSFSLDAYFSLENIGIQQSVETEKLKPLALEVIEIGNQYNLTPSEVVLAIKNAQYPTRTAYLEAQKAKSRKLYGDYFQSQNLYGFSRNTDEKLEAKIYVNLELRKLAAKILAKLNAIAAKQALQDVIADQNFVELRQFAELRQAAAYAVVKIGGFNDDYLLQLLSDRDENVQKSVLDAISDNKDASAIPAIMTIVMDFNHSQWREGMETILTIGGYEAANVFIRLIQESTNQFIRDNAISYLASTRTSIAGSFLAEYIPTHPEFTDWDYMIEDLGFTGEKGLIPLINPYLEKEYTRNKAIVALLRLGDEHAFQQAIVELSTPRKSSNSISYSEEVQILQDRLNMAKAIADDLAFLTANFATIKKAIAQTDDLEIFKVLQTAIDSVAHSSIAA